MNLQPQNQILAVSRGKVSFDLLHIVMAPKSKKTNETSSAADDESAK